MIESVKRGGLLTLPSSTLPDYFQLNAIRYRAQHDFQNFWLHNQLDALLVAPAPNTATPLDEWKCITYTALWNMLDYPAVVIPTGRVSDGDKADDPREMAKFGGEDEENYGICEYLSLWALRGCWGFFFAVVVKGYLLADLLIC